ncbi:Membrane-bound transcription factor site-1 protease, partial [Tyrophagus putrescentiae]
TSSCGDGLNEDELPQLNLVNFQSDIVDNEYIISFKHFYKASTRLKFIRKSLQKLSLNGSQWTCVERANAASTFPSDFDLLQMHANIPLSVLSDSLRHHPSIKDVTPQRKVIRNLQHVNSSTDSDISLHYQSRQMSWINSFSFDSYSITDTRRRLLRAIPVQITNVLQADVLHKHFKKIKERTNWTNERTFDDGLGHGTFVAGVIVSSSKECFGFAPDAELHVYRVFTNNQVSYTSWFLDAFNYAILKKINVLNLSIGGTGLYGPAICG